MYILLYTMRRPPPCRRNPLSAYFPEINFPPPCQEAVACRSHAGHMQVTGRSQAGHRQVIGNSR